MRGSRPPNQSNGRQRRDETRDSSNPRSALPRGQQSLTQMAFGQPSFGQPLREANPSAVARAAPQSPNQSAAHSPIRDTSVRTTASVPLQMGKASVGDVGVCVFGHDFGGNSRNRQSHSPRSAKAHVFVTLIPSPTTSTGSPVESRVLDGSGRIGEGKAARACDVSATGTSVPSFNRRYASSLT